MFDIDASVRSIACISCFDTIRRPQLSQQRQGSKLTSISISLCVYMCCHTYIYICRGITILAQIATYSILKTIFRHGNRLPTSKYFPGTIFVGIGNSFLPTQILGNFFTVLIQKSPCPVPAQAHGPDDRPIDKRAES